jgi:hypothetical protein
MILTTLTAIIVLGFQGAGNAKDVQSSPPARQEIVEIKVANGGAKKIADQLKTVKLEGVSLVSIDPKGTAIIVRGTAAGIKSVREMIDRIQSPAKVLKRFRLFHADAEMVHKAIMTKPIAGIDFISYDPTTNEIVARGTGKAMEQLAAKLAVLDRIDP